MKRRNAESGKMRRAVKRTKITEGMCGNSMLYLKLVILWAAVILSDHFMEFRFEFLWPIWMMLKSVYESFKYQGLAFSVFFMCIALTSDVICYFFMPVSWMFVIASTYVWVQCVTYTDKGVCLPTVAICCIIAYVESMVRASVRGLELSKPLAAHCVGYPAVTLGFGVKSFVRDQLKMREQRLMRDDSDFYYFFMKDNLQDGPEYQPDHKATNREDRQHHPVEHNHSHEPKANGSVHKHRKSKGDASEHNNIKLDKIEKNHTSPQTAVKDKDKSHAHTNGHVTTHDDDERHETHKSAKSSKSEKKESICHKEEKKKNKNRDREVADKSTESKEQLKEQEVSTKEVTKPQKENSNTSGKEKEKEPRECRSECSARRELAQLQQQYQKLLTLNAELNTKLSQCRTSERLSMERRIAEERRARLIAVRELAKAQQKIESRRNGECDSEWCRSKMSQAESESSSLKRELSRLRDKNNRIQRELTLAGQQCAASERVGSSWQSLRDRASSLEKTLSAENRLKLDLLSALGEAKRQLDIRDEVMTRQEKEIRELKMQLMSVSDMGRFKMNDSPRMDPNASVYSPHHIISDA